MNVQASAIKEKALLVIDWVTGDFIHFAVTMAVIFIFFFWFLMRKGLNIDDKLHARFTELFLIALFFGLLVMANNGVLESFISSLFLF